MRTEIGDAQVAADCSFLESNRIVHDQHIATLNQHGIVVIHNVLSLERLDAIRNSIGPTNTTLQARYMSSANDADVRQDVIQWVRQSSDDDNDEHEHLDYAIALVRGMAYRLEHGGDGGTDDDTTARQSSSAPLMTFARHLLVPRDCQLAVYHPTTNIKNGHGNGYARHLDRCMASFWQLGLLEYWRLSDYRSRVLTIILYLNGPNRSHSDGGALRYWRPPPVVPSRSTTTMTNHNVSSSTTTTTESPGAHDDNEQQGIDDHNNSIVVDILPVGGTLVIFDASRIHHQVLPSFGAEPRTALTCWVTGELVVIGDRPEGGNSVGE
jgi:hypothetical protein